MKLLGNRHHSKILFVYPKLLTFVKKDLDILRSRYNVKTVLYKGKSAKFKIFREVFWSDLTFSWFADKHAFMTVLFSKLLWKKSVVVVGGYDVVNMPEINYGLSITRKGKLITRLIFKLADKIIAISESSRLEVIRNIGVNPPKIVTIYLGFNSYQFQPNEKKRSEILTVGFVRKDTLKRKGLETFVRSAQYLPYINFILVGRWEDDSIDFLRSIASPNVIFENFLPDGELIEYYKRAKVYVQVSAHEGFGCALAEAMLFECVPVVTDRGAIPEVVGDTGFYVPLSNPKETALAIEKALRSNKGEKARKRIIEKFPFSNRKRALLGIIEKMK